MCNDLTTLSNIDVRDNVGDALRVVDPEATRDLDGWIAALDRVVTDRGWRADAVLAAADVRDSGGRVDDQPRSTKT